MSTTATAVPTGTWNIDPVHSRVGFSVKHLGISTVRGEFRNYDGLLVVGEDGSITASGTVAVDSIETRQADRDGHLKSADFFDAENHPWLEFRSTSVAHVRGDEYRITGDLTIRETTRPITFDATLLGFYTGMQGQRRVGIAARTKINRKDWGLNWNVALEAGGWLVGEDIKIEVEVAADLAAAGQAAAA